MTLIYYYFIKLTSIQLKSALIAIGFDMIMIVHRHHPFTHPTKTATWSHKPFLLSSFLNYLDALELH